MNTDKKTQLEAEIAQKKAELAQLEQQLKAADIAPKRLLQLFDGCEIRIDLEKYPNSVFFFKEGKYFFEIEKNYLWCSYDRVWKVFKEEFSMNYDDTQSLIKAAVEEHFKMKGVTPRCYNGKGTLTVEEHFKMKGVTPLWAGTFACEAVEEHFKMKGVTPIKTT